MAAIQPLGFLLVVTREWLVERASANIGDYLGATPQSAIGRPLLDLLGPDTVHSLRNQLALLRSPLGIARLFGCSVREQRFDFAVQPHGQGALIEGLRAGPVEHGDTIATVRALADRLERLPDRDQLLEQAARQLRALTGFDRVAIYRRASDGSFKLTAETARTLGTADATLHPDEQTAPAAGLAVVGDRSAEAVAIHPAGELRAEPLLRAPDAGHCQRLSDCGAAASLTVPLSVRGEPWGMVVCHHPSPRFPAFERQSALGLFAQMLGLLIALREGGA